MYVGSVHVIAAGPTKSMTAGHPQSCTEAEWGSAFVNKTDPLSDRGHVRSSVPSDREQ